MGLISSIDNRRILEFYSDDTFKIESLPVYDNSVIKRKDEIITEAWPIMNKIMLPFKGSELGFKKNERIMIISETDIIEDPFDLLKPEEKPKEGPELIKDFIKAKAESVVYRHQAKPKSTTTLNRVVIFLGIALMGMIVIALVSLLKG